MTKVLFVGPMTPPIHGQSIAFEEIYTKTKFEKYLVNQNFENDSLFKKIGKTLNSLIKITYLLFRYDDIDVVYFTCSRSKFGSIKDIYLLYISSLFNKRIINHLHGLGVNEFYKSLSPLHQKLLHKAYSKIDTSVVLLPSMKKEFSVIWPNMKLSVVSNFYSDELNCINSKPENEVIQLLYLSNLIESKGIFDLLEAVKYIEESGVQYKLMIAGAFMNDEQHSAKETEKKFNKLISQNGNITYIGTVYGQEKFNLLKNSDLFILPTYYKMEAFPISILEAMRAGNAIVTTKHNYLPEVVSSKNGTLVPVKNPKAIASAIIFYSQNFTILKEVQQYNMKITEENFSSVKYIETLDSIFSV